jgi:LuxR family maltose regulon positive regulatory protein
VALLGTKLHPPTPRRRLVLRTRLLERMPEAATPLPRLVLVSAPAGFGKTTVLVQWLEAWRTAEPDDRRAAWVSLDASDDDLDRFLTDLLGAVRLAAPGLADEAQAVLEAQGSAMSVLVLLVNALDDLDGALVLALDDYHVVASAEVHEAVAFLLDHLPAHVTVALTTRADPPLPVTRLRGRGELLELRAADLRFTADEAAAFLSDSMGLDLGPDHVAALERRTEGWAVGLQLAAVGLRQRERPAELVEAFAGSHRFVLDYLVEEVLEGLPADTRTFLVRTSVLEQLAGPLCDALTGRDDGNAVLESLERLNLFVLPLDDGRRWWRYHHLFRDALRARLLAEDPGRVPHLHRTAAGWYAAHARHEEAIEHAIAGEDLDLAADLVEAALPDAQRRRQHRQLRRWCAALPADVVARRPVLGTLSAWNRLTEGDLAAAETLLLDAETTLAAMPAEERLASDERRQLPMTIAMYRAAVAQGRGDTTGVAEHARRVLDLAGAEDHLARGAGGGFLALSLWARGDLEAATGTFGDAMRSLRAAGNLADELGGTVVLAELWRARGRPDEAGRLHEQALASARERPEGALPVTADLHVGLAEALRERGDLDGAAEHLRAAHDLGDVASLPENRHRWHLAMAGLRRAEGDLDAAAALLEEAQAHYLPGFFPDVRPVPALRARVDLARGRPDLARAWAEEHGAATDAEPTILAEYALLTLARLLLAEERYDDALGLLARSLDAAATGGRGGSVVEVRLLQALAHRAAGDVDAAVPAMVRALEDGVPAGYARLFLDEGPAVPELLDELDRRGLATGAVQALRRAAAVAQTATDPLSDPLPEPLSERETEVLRMLATELTGPEVARRLFVSINTLRTHSRHIFTKLGVTTRAAAVRRGRELGLL